MASDYKINIHLNNKTYNSNKVERVCSNIVLAKFLRGVEVKMLQEELKLDAKDEVVLVYVASGKFEPMLKFDGEIIVGITNALVFKAEKGAIYKIPRSNIMSVTHQKNSIFSWDKLIFELKNKTTDTIGIYDRDACEYFCNYLMTQT